MVLSLGTSYLSILRSQTSLHDRSDPGRSSSASWREKAAADAGGVLVPSRMLYRPADLEIWDPPQGTAQYASDEDGESPPMERKVPAGAIEFLGEFLFLDERWNETDPPSYKKFASPRPAPCHTVWSTP